MPHPIIGHTGQKSPNPAAAQIAISPPLTIEYAAT
jgi:hypothetical protein